jgi:hypothetical protein
MENEVRWPPPGTGGAARVCLDGQPLAVRSFAAIGREYLAVPLDVAAGEHSVEVER